MRRATLAAAFAVACCAATMTAAARQDAAAEEWRKLEGGWLVVAAEQRGKPFDVIRGGGLVIVDGTFALKTAAGNEFKGRLRIDATRSPKQLDFLHDKDGLVWEAIYSVTDDTFRLNYVEAGEGNRRPTLFATSADGAGTVIVMNRMTKR